MLRAPQFTFDLINNNFCLWARLMCVCCSDSFEFPVISVRLICVRVYVVEKKSRTFSYHNISFWAQFASEVLIFHCHHQFIWKYMFVCHYFDWLKFIIIIKCCLWNFFFLRWSATTTATVKIKLQQNWEK